MEKVRRNLANRVATMPWSRRGIAISQRSEDFSACADRPATDTRFPFRGLAAPPRPGVRVAPAARTRAVCRGQDRMPGRNGVVREFSGNIGPDPVASQHARRVSVAERATTKCRRGRSTSGALVEIPRCCHHRGTFRFRGPRPRCPRRIGQSAHGSNTVAETRGVQSHGIQRGTTAGGGGVRGVSRTM